MFASFNRPGFRDRSGRTWEKHAMKRFMALVALGLSTMASGQKLPADYVDVGPAPEDPMGSIKRLMIDELRDPDSAQYKFLGIHPARCKAGWLNGGKDWYGYAASIEVNAKNGMGGYTGFKPTTVLLQGESAIKSFEGANFGAYGPSKGPLGLGGGAGVCRLLDQ